MVPSCAFGHSDILQCLCPLQESNGRPQLGLRVAKDGEAATIAIRTLLQVIAASGPTRVLSTWANQLKNPQLPEHVQADGWKGLWKPSRQTSPISSLNVSSAAPTEGWSYCENTPLVSLSDTGCFVFCSPWVLELGDEGCAFLKNHSTLTVLER